MSRAVKTWDDFTPKYRKELALSLADTIMEKTVSLDEAASFLQLVGQVIQKKTGQTLRNLVFNQVEFTTSQAETLLRSLGQLREKYATHNSQLHLPKVSVQEMDCATVSSCIALKTLNSFGYNIGRKEYKHATSTEPKSAARENRVGRTTFPWRTSLNLLGQSLAMSMNSYDDIWPRSTFSLISLLPLLGTLRLC